MSDELDVPTWLEREIERVVGLRGVMRGGVDEEKITGPWMRTRQP